jgi:hypothetical protein
MLFLVFQFFMCSFLVFYFIQLKSLFTKHLIFILFYLGWFITSLIVKANHNYLNIDMDTSLCAVILPTNLFYSINYRTLFIDKGSISVFFILILLIENMLLEILRFIIPHTKTFKKIMENFPKINKLLGFKGDDEFIKQKITKSYFIKLLSDFWSFIGTVVTLVSIKISPNNTYFENYFDKDFTLIIKLTIMFLAELISFIIINLFLRKFFKISAWKHYKIITCRLSLGLICIFWASHILQDPIFAIISTNENFCKQ